MEDRSSRKGFLELTFLILSEIESSLYFFLVANRVLNNFNKLETHRLLRKKRQ